MKNRFILILSVFASVAVLADEGESSGKLNRAARVVAGVEAIGHRHGLANKALNPDVLGENGLPTELPFVIEDQYRFGGFGRLSLFFTGRLFNWIVTDIGLSTTVAWHETIAVHAGLLIRPSFILPIAPL